MAQSTTTVTPENPTPPTNFGAGYVGGYPPTAPGLPYLDDGTAGPLTAFAAPQSGTVSEGAGTEVIWTASSSNPIATGQLIAMSDLGNYTTAPNRDHASSLSPATNPTLTLIAPTSTAHGTGTVTLTATGTAFTAISTIYVNGNPQKTTFVSPTSLTAVVTINPAAGTWPVAVITGGVTTAPQTWTFT